jgi:hypothetical protein
LPPAGGGTTIPDGILSQLGSAPGELARPSPDDTSAAPATRLNFLVRTANWWDSRYALGPGYVGLQKPAVVCINLVVGKSVVAGGITVSIFDAKYYMSPQYITAEYRFYRWNGTSWALQQQVPAGTSLGDLTVAVPSASTSTTIPTGYYHVVVVLTWWVGPNWVKAAGQTYEFNAQNEYAGTGGTGPGYCKV